MIFKFENDFAGSLHCIPMIVRQKLDLVGIKLSLKQWNRFPHDARAALVERPCAPGEERDSYRQQVLDLIAAHSSEPPSPLKDPRFEDWTDTQHIPEPVLTQAEQDGVPAPSLDVWAALTPLQRFVLVKLSRSKHENANFVPAMREFGLLPSA